MNRREEAKELRKQGFTVLEIADKMGLEQTTVMTYIYSKLETIKRIRMRRTRKYTIQKVRSITREQLSYFNLPQEWEDEVIRLFTIYHYSKGFRTGGGRNFKVDVQSLIQLLCRRYKIPTPRNLQTLTYQSRRGRLQSGYMDVLQLLDGIKAAKPIDYIKYFIKRENLPEEEILKAKELIQKIPKVSLQSRNPRSLAGAILYQIHLPPNPRVQKNRIYTQRYIANQLEITQAVLRRCWKKFFP